MGDHHAVKAVPGLKNMPGDEPPLLGLDIGRIQVEDIPDGEGIAVPQRPQAAGKPLAVNAGGKPLVGEPGGDGAAGGEQEDALHGWASFEQSARAWGGR